MLGSPSLGAFRFEVARAPCKINVDLRGQPVRAVQRHGFDSALGNTAVDDTTARARGLLNAT